MTKPLSIAVLGAGRIAQTHAAVLAANPDTHIAFICDPVEHIGRPLANKYNATFLTDPEQAITSPEVDAVYICSPSQFHCQQIILAARNNKHIFCEKPIGKTVQEGREAVAVANETGVVLMVGFNRRFDTHFSRLRRAIEQGRVGDPISLSLVSRDPSEPSIEYVRGGGGLFMDMAIHDLDMMRFLLSGGSRVGSPVAVQAFGSSMIDSRLQSMRHPSERIDTALIAVSFSNGTQASIICCRANPHGYDQRAEIFGKNGTLKLNNPHPSALQEMTEKGERNADEMCDFFLDRYYNAYADECREFVECVRLGKEPSCTGSDGVAALVLAAACDLSLAQGRVVRLSELESSL